MKDDYGFHMRFTTQKLIKSESHIEVNLISKCKILTTEMFS